MFSWIKVAKQLSENGVLGMNDRNYSVIAKYNKRSLYTLVDDKVKTKKLANNININTPRMIGIIEHQYEVDNLLKIVEGYQTFVIKPAHGSGGKGVLVIKNYDGEKFYSAAGEVLTFKDVYQHVSNTLSGLFSLGGRYDVALIEETVNFSDVFKNFSYHGIPDVRVIVYKGYPAMVMMRLATKESDGKANLHQGGVGVGLDVKTGETLRAVLHNKPVTIHPDTGANLMDLKVPYWREHLLIGALAYDMTGLGYLGADIVSDKNRGPMMLEINARPGLAIQIANGKGLKTRLKEIDETYPTGLSAEERVDYVLNK
ncbi:MAG: alpha-L-glutamate ligase-like protein [Alphaproteobacteria bacterium]|nr:alpha-L-glutamate ligase-like protein [Alphaproteobacteria bacterium]